MRATDCVVPTLDSRPMNNIPTLYRPAFSLPTTLFTQPCPVSNECLTAAYISLSHQKQRCQHLHRMLVLSLQALFQRENPFCHTGVFVSPKRQLRRTVSIGKLSVIPSVVPDDTRQHGETNTTKGKRGKFQAERKARLQGKRKSREGQDLWTSRANCKT